MVNIWAQTHLGPVRPEANLPIYLSIKSEHFLFFRIPRTLLLPDRQKKHTMEKNEDDVVKNDTAEFLAWIASEINLLT